MSIFINSRISEQIELLLALISVVKFDIELKDETSDMFVSLDETIILELWCMVDLMTADDLFCKLEMKALIF